MQRSQPGESDREQWATGRLLSTAARLVEHSWNTRLREQQVSHAGLIVLHLLSRGPATARDLAAAQSLTEQTLGRTLAHLESTGHVRRDTDPGDRRRRLVDLTGDGRDLLAQLSGDGDEFVDAALRDSGHDPAAFRAALLALLEVWNPRNVSHDDDRAAERSGAGDPDGP